jgi:hypothetical protein
VERRAVLALRRVVRTALVEVRRPGGLDREHIRRLVEDAVAAGTPATPAGETPPHAVTDR